MKVEDTRKIDAILAGASELSIENQECILTTIKGMLFTRDLIMKKSEKYENLPRTLV